MPFAELVQVQGLGAAELAAAFEHLAAGGVGNDLPHAAVGALVQGPLVFGGPGDRRSRKWTC